VLNEFDIKDSMFSKFGFRKNNIPLKYKVDGLKLERWCCKTLINTVLSQKYEDKTNIEIDYVSLLPYIYENKKFEKPYGLYIDCTIGKKVEKQGIKILPIFHKNELSGAIFILMGIELRLQIMSSKKLEILDESKKVVDLSINGLFENKQLNWHNESINSVYTNGKKQILLQKINFIW
jgi:hypothetical protein